MSQYILINRIKVQNANAIAGFTWGFPAITNFLGFTHNLSRKLKSKIDFQDISLSGCAVIANEHNVHCYKTAGGICFTQNKKPQYLHGTSKADTKKTPSIIEEGKMNMTVSLLINFDGYLGNNETCFLDWLKNICYLQRLAGGTILNIKSIELINLNDGLELQKLKRKLLPGFILQDRSEYLNNQFEKLKKVKPGIELIDAWLDFFALKQKARPKSNLIDKHLQNQLDKNLENEETEKLLECWQTHKETPYEEKNIPSELKKHFASLEEQSNKNLLEQWKIYCNPTDKTEVNLEYIKKPEKGYLVPIMTGYKAVSRVYKNNEIANTRDSETDVCFVEAIHSIGEWQSVHRVKTNEELHNSLWYYTPYEEDWYLCQQGIELNNSLDNDYEQTTSIYD